MNVIPNNFTQRNLHIRTSIIIGRGNQQFNPATACYNSIQNATSETNPQRTMLLLVPLAISPTHTASSGMHRDPWALWEVVTVQGIWPVGQVGERSDCSGQLVRASSSPSSQLLMPSHKAVLGTQRPSPHLNSSSSHFSVYLQMISLIPSFSFLLLQNNYNQCMKTL